MIKRSRYLEKILPFIDTELIKVLTGVRRSGKSVMMRLIREELIENRGVQPEQLIEMNFEELRYERFTDYHELNGFLEDKLSQLKGKKAYLFLDEIQEVDSFEKVVNSLRATYQDKVDIYLTGSNAKLLSGELSTLLGGRYVQFHIYPFVFSEYIEAKKTLGLEKSSREFFQDFVIDGGTPFLATQNFSPDERDSYLRDLYNSIVLKDVVQRENIRDTHLLQQIFTFALGNIGRIFSGRSVVKYLKSENINTATNTVNNYIHFGENAYFFVPAQQYDLQGKKLLSDQKKVYVVDHGLRETVLGRNTTDIELVLENIVLLELKSRGYSVMIGRNGDLEVDFIAERNHNNEKEKIYIQVSYLLASPETRAREFRSLASIPDNYPKIVLSLDEITRGQEGIQHLNLIDWLLDYGE